MDPHHRRLITLNLIGGPAVLASYAHGFLNYEDPSRLWGGIPDAVRGLYTTNMFFAAAGYLLFTWVLWRRVDPRRVRTFGQLGFTWFARSYGLILLCSTLWLPLCFYALDDAPRAWTGLLWYVIWLDLALVAAGSLGVLVGLHRLDRATPGRRLALVGALFFCLQTVALDFLIWPWFFTP